MEDLERIEFETKLRQVISLKNAYKDRCRELLLIIEKLDSEIYQALIEENKYC